MRKIRRNVLIATAAAVFVTLTIILMIRFTPQPPVSEMEYARETLSLAAKNKADTYSKKLYTEAKAYYDSAMVNWQRQNKRFIFSRDYEKVEILANLAIKNAEESGENSINSTSVLELKLKQKFNTLKELISEINKLFSAYPLSSETRTRISQGKMLLEEAEIFYEKGQFFQANRKLTDAEYLLTNSYDVASAHLREYFKSYSLWKSWITKTINDSKKNNDYSIIIDKFSRKCFIYLNGARKMEFNAELGTNWVGDKRLKGDKATPEGMYKISKKFDARKTKYYKALLLDYPNEEDIAKFKAEISKGSLPESAKIGGLIEIHGNGGKGIDWTEGCVALTDKEMDVVFKITRVGTPVTIVGSMVELGNIVNR